MPTQDFGLGFSRTEAVQIWIGVVIMTLAFALAYIGGAFNFIFYFRLGGAPLVFLIIIGSFVAVITAFFLHEIAHKVVAQRYGAVAEYRHFPAGLILGLITGAFGAMLAMPGATVVTGARVSNRQQVRISAAGPATNVACAAVFMGLSLALGTAPGRFHDPVAIVIGAIAFVNLLLAGFSLIPLLPIKVHRKVAGRFDVTISFPASDGFLILVSNREAWLFLVLVLLVLGAAGHFLALF
jgi:Zn-dependent protease